MANPVAIITGVILYVKGEERASELAVYNDGIPEWPVRFGFDGGSLWLSREQAEELRKVLN